MDTIKFNEKHTQLASQAPYYLGLDIGTSSIGYAITDENYNVIKRAGKSLWGVHIFQEANTAAERRMFRVARRRRKRLKTRIKLLQEFFSEAINAVDPAFFIRMKDSFFYPDDKHENQTNTLFNDENYKDKDYFEAYPTIYHLRNELYNSQEPHDVRLVYLACHHILKHRGHFLTDSLNIEQNEQGAQQKLYAFLDNYKLDTPLFPEHTQKEVWEILNNPRRTRTDKARALQQLLNNQDKRSKEICTLLAGGTAKIKNFLNEEDEELIEAAGKLSVCLLDNYAENTELQDELQKIMGDEKELIDAAYELRQAMTLHQLLQKDEHHSYGTLSEARVAIFEQHQKDLKTLKTIINELLKGHPEKSEEISAIKFKIFRENEKNTTNYVAYSGHIGQSGQGSPEKTCSQADFLDFLKKTLKNVWDDIQDEDFKTRVELGSFMPRIRSSANGVIPYQLQEHELKQILKNASQYLPFLVECQDQIVSLLTFRIPYYVGPFDTRSKFAWLKRNPGYEQTPIRPWNAKLVINEAETAELFIKNLTNKCTYLLGEDVLPKQSLLYEEYLAWNAINNLRYDHNRLEREVREKLYQDLFLKPVRSGKITQKAVLRLLNAYGLNSSGNKLDGMDLEIPVKFRSHKDFETYMNEGTLCRFDVERIIEKLTAFPDSFELICDWLKQEFGTQLNDDQIKSIAKLQYKDWGRLSRKLLDGLRSEFSDGQERSVIEIMRESGLNLMEVLNDKRFRFIEKIDAFNGLSHAQKGLITEEYLDELNLSPPVHKALRRTLLLCKELFGIMGGAPSKLFIEMAREKETEKKRTVKRKDKLAELYKNLKQEKELWAALNQFPEDTFKSKALYLYALQQGRCMYSGEIIPLEDLNNKEKYDIDHIYPRSLTKDDSFNNLVLVKQNLNRSKSNTYPLAADIRSQNAQRWLALKAAGFMSEEKYFRLTRNYPLSPEELEQFVNRQLVETRQSTKIVLKILTDLLTETSVIPVKAGLVSDFRYLDGLRDKAAAHFYFPKVRDLNDYHHAKDAYLNIVVGNVYHSVFNKEFYKRLKQHDQNYSLVRLFDYDHKGAWTKGEDGTIRTVQKMMDRDNVLLSLEAKRQRGKLFDINIVKKGNGQLPIKTSLRPLHKLERYGGYNKVSASHFCIIKTKKGKKEKYEIVPLPIMLNSKHFDDTAVWDYLKKNKPDIIDICEKEVKYNGIIEIDGIRYIILAKTGTSIKCAVPIQGKYDRKLTEALKELERYAKKDGQPQLNIDLVNLYDTLSQKLMKKPFVDYSPLKGQGEKLLDCREDFIALEQDLKIKIIMNILNLLTGKGRVVDLSDVYSPSAGKKTGGQSGMITIPMNQDVDSKIRIIDTSISGFYENIREVK